MSVASIIPLEIMELKDMYRTLKRENEHLKDLLNDKEKLLASAIDIFYFIPNLKSLRRKLRSNIQLKVKSGVISSNRAKEVYI